MFKLLHGKNKYSRGIKILVEAAYVGIGLYGFKIRHDESNETSTDVTIDLQSGNDRYYLTIPDDKLDSVIQRLQEAKARKERNAYVASLKG